MTTSITGVEDQASATTLVAGGPEVAAPTVLVVDDEASVRGIVQDRLGLEGYRVLSAASGWSAAAILDAADTGWINLVLLDFGLPGGGFEFVEWLKVAHPRTRIVLMVGGQALDPTRMTLVEALAATSIEKPFHADALARIVAHELAERSAYGPHEAPTSDEE